ncbi:hypothetical protein AAG570_005973 [Ranatra chinensis]|uniref:WAPL domain-containing protein n=1 Tax=Ranatra chinensis TaxID=642074 RepID=A0ABD0Y9L8_9HEMI
MQGSDEQGSEVQGPDVQGSEVQGPDVQGSEVQGPDTKVETTDAEPLPVSLPPEPEPLCASEEPQPQPQSEPQPQPPKAAARLPRKGCIFKSRGASGEKRQAHYIHKWSDVKEPEVTQDGKTPSLTKPKVDAEFEPETLTRITSYHMSNADLDDDSEPITSVTCSKRSKEFYTVVRNVKKAHQIQESGEFQEFNDDVEYILDALQDNNPISTRCLSAITLASKCMVPAFRMHVRAHGTVTKFFKALHDATKDQRLGMCTATVMFVLSQDRLNMDVDRDSLELMLNLLESDTSHNSALDDCGLSDVQLQKTKERVRSLCQEIQEQGHGKHLNLDNITVGHLAMETLLSLTSRRAGEWFKEELRDLGGLEHIIKTVVDTCEPVLSSVTDWTPQLMDRLRKADRCLRVLENVTLHNEENNNYLLTYGEGILVDTVVRVFRVCDDSLASHPVASPLDKHSVGAVIRDCLMSILKVLINLTHDFNNKSFGSALAGKRQGVIEASLHVIMAIPEYVPEEQKFDFIILALILLINLIEHCDSNRKLLMEARVPSTPTFVFSDCEQESAVSALVSLFLQHEELARTEEKKTDAILDGEKPIETQQQKSQEEFIEETVAVLLQKAGRHMEHTLVGAYVAILLGYMTLENEEYERLVRSYMPNRSYEVMLSVLQKFYNFMTLTAAVSSRSFYFSPVIFLNCEYSKLTLMRIVPIDWFQYFHYAHVRLTLRMGQF